MKIRNFADFDSQIPLASRPGSTVLLRFQDVWGGFADFSRAHETSRTTYELRNGVISTIRRFPIEEFALDTLENFLQPQAVDKSPKIPKLSEFRPKSGICLVCPRSSAIERNHWNFIGNNDNKDLPGLNSFCFGKLLPRNHRKQPGKASRGVAALANTKNITKNRKFRSD